MVNFTKEQKDQFKNVEFGMFLQEFKPENKEINLSKTINPEVSAELETMDIDNIKRVSFDKAFENAESYLVFEMGNIKNLKRAMQDDETEFFYFANDNISIKIKKEDISIDGNMVYIYEWQEV